MANKLLSALTAATLFALDNGGAELEKITAANLFGNVPVPIGLPAGTALLPSLTFTGDENTGFYRVAADTIGLTTNGIFAGSFGTAANTLLWNTIVGSSATGVTPAGTFHVRRNPSGATPTATPAFVIENSSNCIFSIMAPDNVSTIIEFSSPSDSRGAVIGWTYNGGTFTVASSKVGASVILQGDNNVTNLTLSGAVGSEVGTFAGKVGVGGTVPVVLLDFGVSSDLSGTDQVLGLRTNANSRFGMGFQDDNFAFYVPSDITASSGWSFGMMLAADGTTFTERLRISRTGNLTLNDGDVTLSEGKLTITDTANETTVQINSSATTAVGLSCVADSLTTGFGANFYSNSADASARPIVQIFNDHASATGAYCLQMKQDAANAFMNLVGTAAANTTDPISTLTTPGAILGFVQIDINGTKEWFARYADPS